MTTDPLAHICSGWCNHPEVPTVVVTLAYLDSLRAEIARLNETLNSEIAECVRLRKIEERIMAAVKALPVLVLPTGTYVDVEGVYEAIEP